MKRLSIILISILFIFTLVACGNKCEHTYSGDCDTTCNECGKAREVSTEHTYSDACDTICNECEETREKATEHIYSADCDASCNECGSQREATGKHSWKPVENDEPCSQREYCVCGEIKDDYVEHIWKDATCKAPKTCETCGDTEGEPSEHAPKPDDGDCTTEIGCQTCDEILTPAEAEHIPIKADDGNCMTFVWCKNCVQHAIEATTAHKDTNGDHRCENPGCLFPFNRDSYIIEDTIGVGQIASAPIASSDRNLIPVISDETVFKIESMGFNENGGNAIVTGRGLKEGTAMVAFFTSDGLNVVSRYEYTIKEEETIRIGEGELVSDIAVDKTTLEVYRDDTLVTYTITTSADVDRLEFAQVTHTHQMFLFDDLIEEEARADANLVIFELDKLIIDNNSLSDTFVVNKALGTRYSATKTINGDTATWTIKWDLGYTAVRFIRIKALDTDTNTEQTNYVKLNITYPVLSDDEEGFVKAVELFVKSNFTAPMLFKVDDGSMGDFGDGHANFIGVGDFANRFINTVIYGGNSVDYLTNYAPMNIYDINSFILQHQSTMELFNGKNVLCDFGYYYGYTIGFYYPISDELRAVIAYQNGWEIDEELFPYAHSILEKASLVLDEIIEDDMTDFEKEKAIYTWMYEQGVNGLANGWTVVPEGIDKGKALKTAYGLLNNYGGDCMAWSGTFYTLCNMVGLDCVTVDVSDEAGGPTEDYRANHRINMIKLDGEYYFVDAFWSWQKANPDDGTYRYMNMTTETAATIYTWKTEENGGPFVCDYESYLVDAQTGELINK